MTFPCLNSGGDGNFKLRVKEQGDELSLQDGILEVGNFVVSPMVFHLGPGESIDIEVQICFLLVKFFYIICWVWCRLISILTLLETIHQIFSWSVIMDKSTLSPSLVMILPKCM